MTTAVQRRRGTNTEHASFTGLEGEISVNTTNESVHVHDGSTAGGFELMRADGANSTVTLGDISGVTAGTGLSGGGTTGTVTLDIDGTVATLAGTQTFTNKTLTSPILNTPTIGTSFTIGGATITEAELEILDGATVTTTELNYVDGVTSAIQTQIDAKAPLASPSFTGNVSVGGTVDGRDLAADGTKLDLINQGVATTDSPAFAGLTVDTTTLAVDSTNNRVGIGTTSPSQKLTVSGTDSRIYLTGANTDINMDASANGQLHLNGNAYGFGIALNASGANLYTNSVSRDLIFGVNETEVMRVTDSKVGIGTSSPAKLLDISSNSAPTVRLSNTRNDTNWTADPVFGALEFHSADISGSGPSVRASVKAEAATAFGNATELVFRNGDANGVQQENLRIDYFGNVGIGTTTVGQFDSTNVGLTVDSGNSYSGIAMTDGATTSTLAQGFSTTYLYNQANGGMLFGTNNTERMRILADGKVGIGTTSPTDKLEVTGNIKIGHGGSADGGQLVLTSSGYSDWNNDNYNGAWRLYNGATERMRIDTSGSIGLRATANVVGSTSGSGAWVSNGNYVAIAREGTSSAHPALYLNQTGVTGQVLQFRKDGTSVGSISTNGSSLPSDRNFKRNIESLDLGLDFVASLNPVTYNYKLDEEGQPVMTGLIAQEVEESLTAAGVEKNSMTLLQHTPTDDVKESDYQMDYLKLVPILINSIKEQQTLIESLTDRIAALEA